MLLLKIFYVSFFIYAGFSFWRPIHINYSIRCVLTFNIFICGAYFLFFFFWAHCNLIFFNLLTNAFHLYFLIFFLLVLHFVCIETAAINLTIFNIFLYYFLWICVSTYYFCITSSLIIFFFMYESIQFPAVYILYALTKTSRALCAALLMGFWTLVGAFFLLISFSYMICIFDIYTFAEYECNCSLIHTSVWWCLCTFVGFGIKLPVWPATSWLLHAHVEAPTFWSIFLSGAYIKYPAFGLILFFKSLYVMPLLVMLSFLSMQLIFALCTLYAQSDLKQVTAAITICEMQLNLIFIFLLAAAGFSYWMFFFLAHAVNTSFGFWLVDDIAKLYQTRCVTHISGLAYTNKELARYVILYMLCIGGFPGTFVFWLELFFLMSCVALNGVYAFFLLFLFNFFIMSIFFGKWHAILFGKLTITRDNKIANNNIFKYAACLLFNFFFIFLL